MDGNSQPKGSIRGIFLGGFSAPADCVEMSMTKMPKVWRLHIRPYGEGVDPSKSFEFCKKERVLGVGWPVDCAQEETLDLEEYRKRAAIGYTKAGELLVVHTIQDKIQQNDLIWTRDRTGQYYIARVNGPWCYRPDGREAGIVNVLPVHLCPVQPSGVPGKVENCFIPQLTLQPIRDPTAVEYSKLLWNQLAGEQRYVVDREQRDIFSLIDAEACEDVVCVYLQMNGYVFVPASRKRSTMRYEYVMIKRDGTGKEAIVQVKTGNVAINCGDFSTYDNVDVFLFATSGNYCGSPLPHIHCILPSDMEQFMRCNPMLMPDRVRRWLSD